jgi:uncharacterized protein YecT (DUF1311 family)
MGSVVAKRRHSTPQLDPAMIKLTVVTVILVSIPLRLAHSEDVQPYELTSRGNIAASASEGYKNSIEACYHGSPGFPPHGHQFIACLKQQVSSESATLDAVVSGTISYLRSSPDKTSRFRQARRTWLQFRDGNCGFARAVAPRSDADEFFLDCVLRSTIDRRVELRSLVGD